MAIRQPYEIDPNVLWKVPACQIAGNRWPSERLTRQNSVLKRTRLERRLQAYFRFIFDHFGWEAELEAAAFAEAGFVLELVLEELVADFFRDFFFGVGEGSVSSMMIFFGGCAAACAAAC